MIPVFELLSAKRYAITFGKEMKEIKNQRTFNRRADYHLSVIVEVFTVEECANISKTWLCDFNLPINPSLKNFDRWHEKIKDYVISHSPSGIPGYHLT